jgi:hypothetical protein
MTADNALIQDVRARLAAAADPARASRMQAYIKSSMPYRGVTSAPPDRLRKEVFAVHPLRSFAAWRDTALRLWRDASNREERYAAIALPGARI